VTEPSDRVRTLLLRADNLLKSVPPTHDAEDRQRRAREALQEARTVAAGGGVDERVVGLIERRLAALEAGGLA
jgi:hypothetical protein